MRLNEAQAAIKTEPVSTPTRPQTHPPVTTPILPPSQPATPSQLLTATTTVPPTNNQNNNLVNPTSEAILTHLLTEHTNHVPPTLYAAKENYDPLEPAGAHEVAFDQYVQMDSNEAGLHYHGGVTGNTNNNNGHSNGHPLENEHQGAYFDQFYSHYDNMRPYSNSSNSCSSTESEPHLQQGN